MILWIKMSIKIIINKQFDQPTNKEKYQTVIYAIYSTYIETPQFTFMLQDGKTSEYCFKALRKKGVNLP